MITELRKKTRERKDLEGRINEKARKIYREN